MIEIPPKDPVSVAEDPDAYQRLPPTAVREIRRDVVLLHRLGGSAWSNVACRIRFAAADVGSQIVAVRAWFSERRVGRFRWLVGPSATPAGIVSLLLASGAAPDENEPELTAMVLDREPPPVPEIRTRPIASIADFEQMERIRQEVFGGGDTARASWRAELHARWSDFQTTASVAFLAESEGRPVSFGVMERTDAGPMLLAGGVTLSGYRGRGAYRALVHARWEAAQRTGALALVTQAQAASRPILERLGFRPTGRILVLVDELGTAPRQAAGPVIQPTQ